MRQARGAGPHQAAPRRGRAAMAPRRGGVNCPSRPPSAPSAWEPRAFLGLLHGLTWTDLPHQWWAIAGLLLVGLLLLELAGRQQAPRY
jgi:hypothetical protein